MEATRHEFEYFKLVKLSPAGEKIGYYNSNIDPQSSWPSTHVDNAQLLTKKELQSFKMFWNRIESIINSGCTIQEIGVY